MNGSQPPGAPDSKSSGEDHRSEMGDQKPLKENDAAKGIKTVGDSLNSQGSRNEENNQASNLPSLSQNVGPASEQNGPSQLNHLSKNPTIEDLINRLFASLAPEFMPEVTCEVIDLFLQKQESNEIMLNIIETLLIDPMLDEAVKNSVTALFCTTSWRISLLGRILENSKLAESDQKVRILDMACSYISGQPKLKDKFLPLPIKLTPEIEVDELERIMDRGELSPGQAFIEYPLAFSQFTNKLPPELYTKDLNPWKIYDLQLKPRWNFAARWMVSYKPNNTKIQSPDSDLTGLIRRFFLIEDSNKNPVYAFLTHLFNNQRYTSTDFGKEMIDFYGESHLYCRVWQKLIKEFDQKSVQITFENVEEILKSEYHLNDFSKKPELLEAADVRDLQERITKLFSLPIDEIRPMIPQIKLQLMTVCRQGRTDKLSPTVLKIAFRTHVNRANKARAEVIREIFRSSNFTLPKTPNPPPKQNPFTKTALHKT